MVTARTILVVEDERLVAMDVQHTLMSFGYSVPRTAASGEDTIRIASESRPDLVVMDIRIKGTQDGIETAAILRRDFDVPVIYLTAYADDGVLDRAKATRPHGYLLKPVRPEELRISIELALHNHELERQLLDRLAQQQKVLDRLELVEERVDRPKSTRATVQRGRIVILDDEPVLLRSMTRVLAHDHDVHAFSDPGEALEFVNQRDDIDLMLCDLILPALSVVELYDRVQREAPELAARMVFVMDCMVPGIIQEFLGSISARRLKKPFDATRLRMYVNEVLASVGHRARKR